MLISVETGLTSCLKILESLKYISDIKKLSGNVTEAEIVIVE